MVTVVPLHGRLGCLPARWRIDHDDGFAGVVVDAEIVGDDSVFRIPPAVDGLAGALDDVSDDLVTIDANFAAQLERELNAANERIKRLEESENRMLNWLTEDCPEAVKKQLSNAWMKSKEAKP